MTDSTPERDPHTARDPKPRPDPKPIPSGNSSRGANASPTAHPSRGANSGPGAHSSRDVEDTSGRGADMARAALEAARAQNSARRSDRTASGGNGAGSAGAKNSASLGAGARRLKRRRWSGPGTDKARDPQPVGDTLAAWLKKTSTGREVTKATLFTRWSELVGADIAEHAEPVSLVDGELVVQAESTAWATQLTWLAPGIVKRINTELGHGTVIHIRSKGPAGPSWRFGNRHVSGRGPRDTYG